MMIRMKWYMWHRLQDLCIKQKYVAAILLGFTLVCIIFLYRRTEDDFYHNQFILPHTGSIHELSSATVRLRHLLSGLTTTKGRTKTDGKWYSSQAPFEFYAYSAFYDDRHSLGSLPVVRIISVAEYIDGKRLYCVLYYKDKAVPQLVRLKALDIGAGIIRHGKGFREYILTCPLESEDIPVNVSVALTLSTAPEWSMPVEVPPKPVIKEEFMVCVSVSYWKMDPYQIVEWMEVLRELGVSKVVVYNNSLEAEAARVFHYYDKSGFVDFRQSWNFVRDSGEFTIHMHMSPVINDCMYRNMYTTKKIIVTDFDELIIPKNKYSYKELLDEVDQVQEKSSHPARHYMFRNAYFFYDIPGEDTSMPKHLRTLRYRNRLPPNIYGYSTKSIISPLACVNMHNHFCWGSTKLYDTYGLTVDVTPKYALNQHYKKCHLDRIERPGTCKQQIESRAVHDDVMLRYKDTLIKNVNIQLAILKLDPL